MYDFPPASQTRVRITFEQCGSVLCFRLLGDDSLDSTNSAEVKHAVVSEITGEVDLVILDVSLANTTWEGQPLNGLDLCRLLKGDPETSGVPILLATAHAMRGDAESFVEGSGADGYVSKPILDHALFVERVQNLLREAA